tara:strand:- start:178 stop:447 length:270 start_codon:yes stop_codon:yes gene_type:complete
MYLLDLNYIKPLWRIEMIARTAEELVESCPRLYVSSAMKIMEEHSLDPYVIWGKETGELLVDMISQEVICRVGDNGCIDTKTLTDWIGY